MNTFTKRLSMAALGFSVVAALAVAPAQAQAAAAGDIFQSGANGGSCTKQWWQHLVAIKR